MRKKALLVCVSEVPECGPGFSLASAGTTTAALCRLLSNLGFEQLVLAGPSASRTGILDAIQTWLMDHDDDSALVFAVSAHGAADDETGVSWFYSHDYDRLDPVTGQRVPKIEDDDFRSRFGGLKRDARLVCVMDSCRDSHSAFTSVLSTARRFLQPVLAFDDPNPPNMVFDLPALNWIELRGCRIDQECRDDGVPAMGIFTRAVVQTTTQPRTVVEAMPEIFRLMGRPSDQIPEAYAPLALHNTELFR